MAIFAFFGTFSGTRLNKDKPSVPYGLKLAEIYFLVYFSDHNVEFEASYTAARIGPVFRCS